MAAPPAAISARGHAFLRWIDRFGSSGAILRPRDIRSRIGRYCGSANVFPHCRRPAAPEDQPAREHGRADRSSFQPSGSFAVGEPRHRPGPEVGTDPQRRRRPEEEVELQAEPQANRPRATHPIPVSPRLQDRHEQQEPGEVQQRRHDPELGQTVGRDPVRRVEDPADQRDVLDQRLAADEPGVGQADQRSRGPRPSAGPSRPGAGGRGRRATRQERPAHRPPEEARPEGREPQELRQPRKRHELEPGVERRHVLVGRGKGVAERPALVVGHPGDRQVEDVVPVGHVVERPLGEPLRQVRFDRQHQPEQGTGEAGGDMARVHGAMVRAGFVNITAWGPRFRPGPPGPRDDAGRAVRIRKNAARSTGPRIAPARSIEKPAALD